MPHAPAKDRQLVLTIGIALLILLLSFGGVWLYLQYAKKLRTQTNYLSLPSIAISRDGHSIRAGIAIRTSGEDANWASRNQQAFEHVMKRALMEADPKKLRSEAGIVAMQESLRDAGNDALGHGKVREVLLTDLLISEGDL
ncbi:flagellar basal body-associated FliL family protein [Noviherbaspirillum sp. Root189]|uniref:flagellar basal body-associated FliL family protein n=1 Tax=Noviherbaspirillum sp. Root189 TaxID=1736487 RepID=UPI00070C6135|nr:flagellar basal body-associated FliL family protein [Noviherbaspirillum sp. Root189]